MRTELIFSFLKEAFTARNITIYYQSVSTAGRYEFFISIRDWNFVSFEVKSMTEKQEIQSKWIKRRKTFSLSHFPQCRIIVKRKPRKSEVLPPPKIE